MTLSVGDVENKQFTPAMRGYHVDQVDDFLDEIVATLRAHEQKVRDAQDRIRTLESDLSSRGSDETTISRAFLAAQRSADALIAEAETQAGRIRGDAETEAGRLTGERDEQRKKLLDEIAVMRAAVIHLRTRLGELAGTVATDVTAMEQAMDAAEAEVREPLFATPSLLDEESSPSESAPDEEAAPEAIEETIEPPATNQAPSTNREVANIIDELPSLDLTEEGPSRVSTRPWERG